MGHQFNGGVVLDTPEEIERFRILALRGALWLETKGLRHSRGSVYAFVKRTFNLKGNKRSVYEQFCTLHGFPTQEESDAAEKIARTKNPTPPTTNGDVH